MRKVSLVLLVVLFGHTLAFSADKDFWNTSPYQQWTEKECERLLHNSPWAKTAVTGRTTLRQTGIGGPDMGTGERNQLVTYTVVIMSALPVRQAMVRLHHLQIKYDTLDDATKATADEAAAKYLAEDFSDRVVVRAHYQANLPTDALDIARAFRNQTPATLRDRATLSAHGVVLQPIGFRSVGDQDSYAEFEFARQPLANIKAGEDLWFALAAFGGPVPGPVDFRLKDMAFAGKPAF